MVNNSVHISVDRLYFEKMFEPQRRRMEKKMKIPLSQSKFTELVARKRLGIKLPKNFNKFKRVRL
jgi:hypothetical protein